MSSRQPNYLRTYRRRSSLEQEDIAFLLGYKDRGTSVSRYEQGHRLPSLRTALALATILHVSTAVLFGGLQKQVQRNISERIVELHSELEHTHGQGRMPALVSRRLRWLDDHHGPAQINEHPSR
jgi:transcriptional regulator with XRE-family HTH domain